MSELTFYKVLGLPILVLQVVAGGMKIIFKGCDLHFINMPQMGLNLWAKIHFCIGNCPKNVPYFVP